MYAFLDGQTVDLSKQIYFGGMEDGAAHEDLYRTPSGEWWLHRWLPGAPRTQDAVRIISEEDAVRWLIEWRRSKEPSNPSDKGRRVRDSVPMHIVPHHEQLTLGRKIIGIEHEFVLPPRSSTLADIEDRQTEFLEPGRVLMYVMRSPAASATSTIGFREKRQEQMLEILQARLETRLPYNPCITVIHCPQESGCDMIIEWPARAKYGVQLKTDGDARDADFVLKTLKQLVDTRLHGLANVFLVLAINITDRPNKSNSTKVRTLLTQLSTYSELAPYATVIQPENAWTLLFPGEECR